jgi:shikimate dehydrogenase
MAETVARGTRLGVLGWPAGHSRSPAFQNAALRAVGLDTWRYQRLPVPPQLFEETVRALPVAGFAGVNVTIPHKHAALAMADSATPRAREIGAANTLLFEAGSGRIHADNTDGPGLIATLPESASGQRAVVLGAGGSARAAVWALLEAGASEVFVWNRHPERAVELCAEIGGTPMVADHSVPADGDLLVNCTSVGLRADDALKDLLLSADQIGRYKTLVDFVYRSGGTTLTRAARSRSVQIVDGLELLVAQGALSFELFTGIAPPVAVMREAVGLA